MSIKKSTSFKDEPKFPRFGDKKEGREEFVEWKRNVRNKLKKKGWDLQAQQQFIIDHLLGSTLEAATSISEKYPDLIVDNFLDTVEEWSFGKLSTHQKKAILGKITWGTKPPTEYLRERVRLYKTPPTS